MGMTYGVPQEWLWSLVVSYSYARDISTINSVWGNS